MAKDKNGFVLYADLIHTTDHLTIEQKGHLLELILQYVNDRDPVTDDQLMRVVFEPIKQQLKRDLRHWEGIKEKRSDAGKASAVKRAEQKATKSTNVKSVEQKEHLSTNATVRVRVKGNVNVNDNVNVREREEGLPFDSENFEIAWKAWKEYKRTEHKFKYKNQKSETGSLAYLLNISGGDETKAIYIIFKSIGNGWKGLLPLKKEDLQFIQKAGYDTELEAIRKRYDL